MPEPRRVLLWLQQGLGKQQVVIKQGMQQGLQCTSRAGASMAAQKAKVR